MAFQDTDPVYMKPKHCAWLLMLPSLAACGGGSPTAPAAPLADLRISAFTASIETLLYGPTELTEYFLAFHLAETGGRTGASIRSVRYTFQPGAGTTTLPSNMH